MKRQLALEQKLHSLDELSNVVGAMKSLAANHLRSSKEALGPARSYRLAVEAAVVKSGVALPSPGTGGTLTIAIGGDVGLCGPYNSRLAQLAYESRQHVPAGPTYCVGRRLARALERNDVAVAKTYSTPTSVAGITDLLLRLADDAFAHYLRDRLSEIVIVAAEFEGVGQFQARCSTLLPIRLEIRKENVTTPRYVSRDYFSHVAIRELLYINLHERLLEALASEHGSRLVACQGAQRWLDSKRERVWRVFRRLRRETSTQETLEIATAARLIRITLETLGTSAEESNRGTMPRSDRRR